MMQFKWRRDECALFWHVVKTTMSCRGAKMLMVMVLVSYALTSLSPYLNGQFVDMLVYGQDMHSIYILAFAIALLGIISAVFSYFAKMLQTSVLNLSYFSFLKEIVSDFQHLPLTDIESTSPLYSAQKINSDTSSITSFVVINMIPLFMNAITMIAVFSANRFSRFIDMHRRHNASWGVLHYGAYAPALTTCRFISKERGRWVPVQLHSITYRTNVRD